jgi:hypothetical protein
MGVHFLAWWHSPPLPFLHLLEFFLCSCEEDEVNVPPVPVTPNILKDWTRTVMAETVYFYYHHHF